MQHPREHSKVVAMRKTIDASTGSSAAWDGQERRAHYRYPAQRFDNDCCNAPDTPDNKFIFREMIVHEIKNGRLSPWRRRRIVRYAAKMGLSAVEAGRLLCECRKQAMAELDASKETSTLQLRIPDTDDHSTATRVAIAVALAILVNAAVILLFA